MYRSVLSKSHSLAKLTNAPQINARCASLINSQANIQQARGYAQAGKAQSVNVMKMKGVYLLAGARTGYGSLNGALAPLTAADLGVAVTKGAIERANIEPADVKGTYAGAVLQAGMGENVARQISIHSGIPTTTPAMTVNKVCSSGMTALIVAAQAVYSGYHNVTVGIGTESMSNAPFMLPRILPYGGCHLMDAIDQDGYLDPVTQCQVGMHAEMTVRDYGITREQQDEWALNSYKKAARAWKDGLFKDECVTINVPQPDGSTKPFCEDEELKRLDADRVPKLKPLFGAKGTLTAANTGGVTDGAAACVLANNEFISKKKLKPMAQVLAISEASLNPEHFALAPPTAVRNMLDATGLTPDKIAQWEVNEPFAMNALSFLKFFNDMSSHNVNIKGGATAIGHPLATNGCRIVVTLMSSLKPNELGVACICNGCGEGSAMLFRKV